MTKKICLSFLLLLFALTTQAQLFQFGIKAGVNYANQTGGSIIVDGTNYKTDAITNYHLGLVAEMKLTKGFSLQPELLYSTQGAKYNAINAVKDFNNDIGYISIPVLAKLNLNNTFSIELGPQASFLLSQKNKVSINDQKSFDFGLAGGLGIRLTKRIFAQARYVAGLSETSTEAKVKNSVVQVSAGLLF